MTETDLAYAAGLIDGEGSINLVRQKSPHYHDGYCYRLLVQIGMTDATAVMWMYATFGGNQKSYDRPDVKTRRVHRWQLNDGRAAELLAMLLPYLKTKKAQAEIALEFRRTRDEGHKTYRYIKPQALKEAEAVLSERIKALNNGVKP